MKRVPRPSKNALEQMYLSDRMTTRAIAERFKVTHTSVKRWLRFYDIPRRAVSKGLAHHGLPEPTKEQLEYLIHTEHRDYRSIGALFGISGTAIMQWVVKLGIRRPSVAETRRKGKPAPDSDAIVAAYKATGSSELAAIINNCGHHVVLDRLHKSGHPVKRPGFDAGNPRACRDGHMVRSALERQVDDWLFLHNIKHEYEPVLPFKSGRRSGRFKADFKAGDTFIELWGVVSERYSQSMKDKIALYAEHSVPLLQLHRSAFFDGTWQQILNDYFLEK